MRLEKRRCQYCGCEQTVDPNMVAITCNKCGKEISGSNFGKKKSSGIRIGVIICWLAIIVVAVQVILIGIKNYNMPSTTEQTQSTTVETVPKEMEFSQSSKEDDEVYADIISIKPEIGLRHFAEIKNRFLVCRCETSTGQTIWVNVFIDDYANDFGSTQNLILPFSTSEIKELTFSPARRIHGTVQEAEERCEGLSEDIGCKMIINYSHSD